MVKRLSKKNKEMVVLALLAAVILGAGVYAGSMYVQDKNSAKQFVQRYQNINQLNYRVHK